MKSLKEIAKESFLNEEQLEMIENVILSHGHFSKYTIRKEVDWFCTRLGMNEYYFKTTPLKILASHIEAVKSAEIIATIQKEKLFKIDLSSESEDEALYLVDDHHSRALEVERRIEKKYPGFRLQSYRTKGKALGIEHLRMYLVYKPKFRIKKEMVYETELTKVACQSFLESATEETIQRYQDVLANAVGKETPLIDVSEKLDTNEHRIMIVINKEASTCFFSNISDVINSYGLVSNRKYVEQFMNGKTVYTFYLDYIQDKQKFENLIEDITLIYVIPESPLFSLFRSGKLTAQETVFGVSAWSFLHQFLSEYNEEYLKLVESLKDSPELIGIVRNLRTRLSKMSYDSARIWKSLVDYYIYLKNAFQIFNKKFNPLLNKSHIDGDIEELRTEILQNISVELDRNIFLMILLFINSILKTNFFKKGKNSIAFMYDPKFLNKVDYPEVPFGLFHIISLEFRGFHIRFKDIARGGIRIVKSSSYQNYMNNSDFIFDENYNLSLTQHKKNKDIPEGGSKGTILLGWEDQDKAEISFKKYVNGLLDLLSPDEEIVDHYGKEIILFLGPDEGTAELMGWAALRARAKKFPYWQAFSTGKPVNMGGIPHDDYGMTTNSVHQYVLKILEKEGIKEKDITKVMTGGPDGDLGSNEILISKDKIMAIIDGSGVLYDPEGINRPELKRLAKARRAVKHFNPSLLSNRGYLVTIEDKNVELPDGEKVANGLEFRNKFHLHPHFKADLFLPCGGRPASININNWDNFVDDQGTPRFNYIVEGANLFITQQARLRLEEYGVIIFKDASANKGGVTSSSLEVFASLALSDKEYDDLMCVRDDEIPSFRKNYIDEIIQVIKKNAEMEFEIIWKENEMKNIPYSILSDRISEKINNIIDTITKSNLVKNEILFQKVIENYCPDILLQYVGFDRIVNRVPYSYLKAIFASWLASHYVYQYGIDANEIDFYDFVKENM